MDRCLCKIVLGFLLIAMGAERSWALYRADDYKPRNYPLQSEYFIDRLPILPAIESMLWYRDANNAYLGSAGSYTTEDLFLIQNLKLQHGLWPDTKFAFNLIWLDGQYENTNKKRNGYDLGDPKNYHTQRRAMLGRLEYVYGTPTAYRSTLGLEYVNFSESNDYPNDSTSKPGSPFPDRLWHLPDAVAGTLEFTGRGLCGCGQS